MIDIARPRSTFSNRLEMWIDRRLSKISVGAIGLLILIVSARLVGGPFEPPYHHQIILLSAILAIITITGLMISLLGYEFVRCSLRIHDHSLVVIATSLMVSGMTLVIFPAIALLT